MTDSLGDILNKSKPSEPPEIKLIKDFVNERTGVIPRVSVTKTSFIVGMPNGASAGTLRFELFQLQRQLGHSRKITIRIDS